MIAYEQGLKLLADFKERLSSPLSRGLVQIYEVLVEICTIVNKFNEAIEHLECLIDIQKASQLSQELI